jgi:GNAT superfamily N-acetyltransferase
MIKIRPSVKLDLDEIMCILGEARETIGRLGIDQWQYGYPSRAIVKEDILLGRSYVVEDEDGICAVFSLIEDGEPTYRKIYSGQWLCEDRPYLALHRIAIRISKRGTGIAGQIIAYIADKAVRENYATIRVDTHHGNIPMRKMLEKNGFLYTGIIYLSNGEERVAYEKAIVELNLNFTEIES